MTWLASLIAFNAIVALALTFRPLSGSRRVIVTRRRLGL